MALETFLGAVFTLLFIAFLVGLITLLYHCFEKIEQKERMKKLQEREALLTRCRAEIQQAFEAHFCNCHCENDGDY